jgi:hypothetical protein
VSEHLARHQAENDALAQALDAKVAQLESERNKYRITKQLLEQSECRVQSDEASAAMAEKELNDLETKLRQAENRVRAMRESQFREAQQLQTLKYVASDLVFQKHDIVATCSSNDDVMMMSCFVKCVLQT